MEAIISGQIGVAVFIEGGTASFVDINKDGNEAKLPIASIPYLFASTTDVEIISLQPKEKVLGRL